MGLCPAGADVESNVAVAISSDKGLCGGINSTVSKYTRAVLKTTEGGERICKQSVLSGRAVVVFAVQH